MQKFIFASGTAVLIELFFPPPSRHLLHEFPAVCPLQITLANCVGPAFTVYLTNHAEILRHCHPLTAMCSLSQLCVIDFLPSCVSHLVLPASTYALVELEILKKILE
jgi:hypothetical protein